MECKNYKKYSELNKSEIEEIQNSLFLLLQYYSIEQRNLFRSIYINKKYGFFKKYSFFKLNKKNTIKVIKFLHASTESFHNIPEALFKIHEGKMNDYEFDFFISCLETFNCVWNTSKDKSGPELIAYGIRPREERVSYLYSSFYIKKILDLLNKTDTNATDEELEKNN